MQPAGVYGFGPFVFDARSRQLSREGPGIALTDRQASLLHHLVTQAGVLVSKDTLVTAVWGDVAVTDNSLEQLILALRRIFREVDDQIYIENVPGRGYRFAADVRRLARRESDEELAALLAPHRAWLEGRAAIETLDRDKIGGARSVFERVLAGAPDRAAAHLGLANACVMQFETTRADAEPDRAALDVAAVHALEACRLEPRLAESWATLGFVLSRTGERLDALAAARRAVELEPDNWRHQFRLSSIGWGEERLRAARRTLALLPGFPLAHFLAATVHVGRGALGDAAHELEAGISAATMPAGGEPRFSGVALHWLLGLIRLAEGDSAGAVAAFDRECALEGSGHLYARECAASAWYASGVLALRQGDRAEAVRAFAEARDRVPRHTMAAVGATIAEGRSWTALVEAAGPQAPDVSDTDRALALAGFASQAHSHPELAGPMTLADAAAAVDRAIAVAEPGNAGWLLPVEPLIHVGADPVLWAPALARLRTRAA